MAKRVSTASKQYVTHNKSTPGRPPSNTRKATPTKTQDTEKAKTDRAAPILSKKSKPSISCTTSDKTDAEVKSSRMMENSGCSQERTKTEHSKELLRIHEVEYEGKIYDLSKSQSKDSKLVQIKTEVIEEELKLRRLGNDLSSLGKFVRLACCGVVGHIELEKETRDVLANVGDITDDTYHTLNDFERTSKRALQSMQTAYAFLKENLEKEALSMFKDIQKDAEKMFKKSEELSDKCKAQSEKVRDLGYKTAEEKKATEEQKLETDKIKNESRLGEQHEKEVRDNSIVKIDKMEKDVAITLDSEQKVFEKKTELAKQFEEKKQLKNQDIKQRKEKLKSKYDEDNRKVARAIAKCQEKFENTLLSDKKQYNETLKELDKTLKQKAKSIEDSYKTEIDEIEKEFEQAKEENKRVYELKSKEEKEKYRKAVSSAEEEYDFTTKQAEKDYYSETQTNDNELQRKLTLATEKLDATLDANRQKYSAEVKGCFWESSKDKVRTEWSEQNANSKKSKSETESNARSVNISANRRAQENKESKLNNAFRDKQSKIQQAEKVKDSKLYEVEEEFNKLSNEAMKAKKTQKDAAEHKKREAICTHQETKEKDELKARQNKEDSEKSAKHIKETEDHKNNVEKENLLKSYQFDLQQLDDELTKAVEEMDQEYQRELSIIDDNFQYLKEKSAKYASDIEILEQQREESFKKMLEFAQKFKDSVASSEGHQTSIECLHEAKSALHNIEASMRKASSFWKKVGKHCEDMTESVLAKQIHSIENTDSVTRKRMYRSEPFKEAALEYTGQWHALKNTCSIASEQITLVQDEINQYLCENPTKEEAVELVKKLATDMLKSDICQRMISDKPANK